MSIDVPLLSGYLSADAAAAELHVHPRTLKRWGASGRGPVSMRVGSRIYYSRTDLVTWLDSLRDVKSKRGKQS